MSIFGIVRAILLGCFIGLGFAFLILAPEFKSIKAENASLKAQVVELKASERLMEKQREKAYKYLDNPGEVQNEGD